MSTTTAMAQQVKVWFDAEADFLEVRLSDKAGFMRETKHDAVMKRVDEEGNLLGFYAGEPAGETEAVGGGLGSGVIGRLAPLTC